ncbi:MAG: SGNH/GDSL hydrolase family protein [Candidatus Binatia bacterium]|nr:SGNH/GDSL hydrolase family protein [Candidatus Binatia bacterium]
MKSWLSGACTALLLASASFAAPAPAPAPRVEVRAGLGNVRAKLDAGEPVTIAFVGGSITALGGWGDGVVGRLQERYGKEAIFSVNAGLSATGSGVAAFRLDREILPHEPDLVVIEFAVNDAGTTPKKTIRAVEGIVRKIWSADPRTDILFVYLFEPSFEAAYGRGKRPRPVRSHEKVAAFHGIPSIDAGVVINQLHRAGALRLKGPRKPEAGAPPAFARDGIHPYARGHRIYARAVSQGLDSILAGPGARDHAGELDRPIVRNHWQAARKVPLAEWMMSGEWRRVTPEGATRRGITVWESAEAGATVEFGFKGEILKIYELRNAEVGGLEIRIGDEVLEPKSYRAPNAGPPLRVLHVRHPFDPETVQRVSIRVVPVEGEVHPVRLSDLLVLGEVVR